MEYRNSLGNIHGDFDGGHYPALMFVGDQTFLIRFLLCFDLAAPFLVGARGFYILREYVLSVICGCWPGGRTRRDPRRRSRPTSKESFLFGTASCSGHLLDVDYLLVSDYSSHRLQPFARRWTKTPASAMAWITSFLTKFFLVFVKIRWRGSWFWCRASSQRPTCWSLEILSSLARRRDLRLQLALQGILVY